MSVTGKCTNGTRPETKRNVIILFLSFLAAVGMMVLILSFHREGTEVKKIPLSQYTQKSKDEIMFDIDRTDSVDNGDYVISGWFVRRGITYPFYNAGGGYSGKSVYNNNYLSFVYDGNVYVLPTKLKKRDDVNDIVNDGIDYCYSGFSARLPKKYVELFHNGKLAMVCVTPDKDRLIYVIDEDE